MVLTLNQAISHINDVINQDGICEECKQEHEQLQEWLIELRERREKDTATHIEEVGY